MLTVRLLGRPGLSRDDRPLPPPRGRKAWALLGYLLLTGRPVARQRLAELFFADARDPLGALRWTLAELRRSLGVPTALRGDPVAADLGEGVEVDVDVLDAAAADPMASVEDAVLRRCADERGLVLLDGVGVEGSGEFTCWLSVQRHRVAAALVARLRQVSAGLLAGGRARDAVGFAACAVELDPLDEGNHALLVRALAMAGDHGAARRQVEICEEVLRRELGVRPGAAVREAAGVATGSVVGSARPGRAAAVSQLEAGRAAIVAGAVDAGLECLRRAASGAARCGDAQLHGRALAALGAALVHAVRGRDEEAGIVLRHALDVAQRAEDAATVVWACRELGFVDVQAGRGATAEGWLAAAQQHARSDVQFAAILGVRGMNASDRGTYAAAFAYLTESVDRARVAGDARQEAWSLSLVARAHLLRGELAAAEPVLDRSLQLVHEQRWIAFQPWPQVLRAELDLAHDDLGQAADALEQAWELARQVDDPCWEGMAARGLGLLATRRHRPDRASRWMQQAATRCTRVSDRYQWIHAHVLDTTAALALDADQPERARDAVTALTGLAARCDLRELLVRAHLHRHRLGDEDAMPIARLLAVDVDNPTLTPLAAAVP
jgi:DNA-binding SARP family transcriptional activator